ncbi:MAG TPA: thioredoxin family protein [Patescibacteria group bacterium]|nr:thioredoxin family protein [Patescibacteria group bacterium]
MKILKIGAIWCPECAIMKPRWAEIERDMPDLKTEYIDLDQQPEIKHNRNIDHVPTFIFIGSDDQEIDRLKGLVEKDDLINKIKEHQGK